VTTNAPLVVTGLYFDIDGSMLLLSCRPRAMIGIGLTRPATEQPWVCEKGMYWPWDQPTVLHFSSSGWKSAVGPVVTACLGPAISSAASRPELSFVDSVMLTCGREAHTGGGEKGGEW